MPRLELGTAESQSARSPVCVHAPRSSGGNEVLPPVSDKVRFGLSLPSKLFIPPSAASPGLPFGLEPGAKPLHPQKLANQFTRASGLRATLYLMYPANTRSPSAMGMLRTEQTT